MIPYTLICDTCSAKRLGRKRANEIKPFLRYCLNCGGREVRIIERPA